MELTPEIIRLINSLNATDDEKQDLYVRLLESDEPTQYEETAETIRARMYNMRNNTRWVENNRSRILKDNAEEIRNLYGKGEKDYDPGPEEKFITSEILWERLKLLSPLLRATVTLVLEGKTCEEAAEREAVDVNTIYQRLHNARKILEDNNEQ